ncbi:MAG: metallophosphoesterase family protein [Paracoccus sp. (in: a-proteobacteria)]|nr:metallophosphoesterase family protein [Paracoccus sp. (in: a-proteobacteria)]
MRVYAIGDIHGHLDKLRAAHALIEADGGADAQVVHIGDLIDRGPDSRGVVQYLIDGQAQGRDWVVLRGNHDHKLVMFLRDPYWIDPGSASGLPYTKNPLHGAGATLGSYGVADVETRPIDAVHAEAVAQVPPAHADWLDRLPYLHRRDGVAFVHAGIRPGIALDAQDPLDLMWIRKDFHNDRRDHGDLIVHGHTPVRQVTHYGNRVNIDTGAGHGHALSAVRIDDAGVWRLDGAGAVRVDPVE